MGSRVRSREKQWSVGSKVEKNSGQSGQKLTESVFSAEWSAAEHLQRIIMAETDANRAWLLDACLKVSIAATAPFDVEADLFCAAYRTKPIS